MDVLARLAINNQTDIVNKVKISLPSKITIFLLEISTILQIHLIHSLQLNHSLLHLNLFPKILKLSLHTLFQNQLQSQPQSQLQLIHHSQPQLIHLNQPQLIHLNQLQNLNLRHIFLLNSQNQKFKSLHQNMYQKIVQM